MVDEVVIGSGKTIRVGNTECALAGDDVPAVIPSVITESRVVNGSVVYLSLAETVADGANVPEVRICARLRLDVVVAQALRDCLAALIDDALKPSDKSQAN